MIPLSRVRYFGTFYSYIPPYRERLNDFPRIESELTTVLGNDGYHVPFLLSTEHRYEQGNVHSILL